MDVNGVQGYRTLISIHALLAESDPITCYPPMPRAVFLSTLSLRRATPLLMFWPFRLCRFLSTLSLRRATRERLVQCFPDWHFYPRSPCGERPRVGVGNADFGIISIHALLAESDRNARPEIRQRDVISIHALLAESDALNTS